jgi:hypothetical protein
LSQDGRARHDAIHDAALAPGGLALIALFKLVKGVVLLLVGAALLRLVDPEIATFLAPAVDLLHLHGHSRLVHSLLLKVSALSSHSVCF